MPQTKKHVSRSRAPRVSRSNRTSAVATQTLTNTKLALATLFLGFSSLAAAASSTPMSAADQARIDARMAHQMNGTSASSTPVATTSTVPTSTGSQVKTSPRGFVTFNYNNDKKTDRIVTSGESIRVQWYMSGHGNPISLRKISFIVKTYGGPTNAADFSQFVLKSGFYSEKVLATAVLQPNSDKITFVLPEPLVLNKYNTAPYGNYGGVALYLEAKASTSGLMTPGAVHTFDFAPDTPENIEVMDMATGDLLGPERIVFGSKSVGKADIALPSEAILMHNTAPVITKWGTALSSSQSAQLNLFSITAKGDRDLKFKGINFDISVEGLGANGNDVGKIHSFRLHESGQGGGMKQQIGKTYPLCLAGAAGVTTPMKCRFATNETVYFEPDSTSPIIIPAGTTRYFYLVADTTDILKGKTTGSVSVRTTVKGETGLKVGNNGYEKNWADGGFVYEYTPINSSVKGPFTASDSYPMNGIVESISL